LFAEVLLTIPGRGPFTYLVPPEKEKLVALGSRVKVPFRGGYRYGVICSLSRDSSAEGKRIKLLEDVYPGWLDVPREILELGRRVSEYYLCGWGEALKSVLTITPPRGRETVQVRMSGGGGTAVPLASEPEPPDVREIADEIFGGAREQYLFRAGDIRFRHLVYSRLVRSFLSQDRSVLLLFPEILSVRRGRSALEKLLGIEIPVYHAALSLRERRCSYQAALRGETRILVGTRSAVFIPMKSLGLIVVDEEQDYSYKQEETPKYHGVHLARMRGELEGARVVLGTSAPRVETYYEAKAGRLKLVGKRESGSSRYKVVSIDLRRLKGERPARRLIAPALLRLLKHTVSSGGRAVLSVSKRGYSAFLKCYDCGFVPRCERCASPLGYDREGRSLGCHYCGTHREVPETCPECGGASLSHRGIGTQRVERILKRELPDAKLFRVDLDAVGRGEEARRAVSEFAGSRASILVGTYMLAKPFYTVRSDLVAVLDADALLGLPDFRAAEKTFQMLTRFSVLASAKSSGETLLIVQSYRPEHLSIVAATSGTYDRFYSAEIEERKAACLPPFSSLVDIVFRGREETAVTEAARRAAELLERSGLRGKYLGPAPKPVERVRGMVRWHLLVRAESGPEAVEIARLVRERIRFPASVKTSVDVDPINLM